ncbi:hypothetical protein PoMZ_08382 [Pyricularia oryzae]|uniref:Protein kinase domain-containing protein n=1 Tax=Pyricularia oryzae TaxID=318829 RepID=A0A4P7NHL2_PYROR|nr:hypothetical protein PoMZ_08382 [Pyricularia oryzae]
MAFKQAYRTDTAFLLFADLATGGDLYSLLIARGYFSELETKWIVRQIVFAVDYMHTKGIAHRDLKLENIMCAVFPSSTDSYSESRTSSITSRYIPTPSATDDGGRVQH